MIKEVKKLISRQQSDQFKYIILELTDFDVELNRLKNTLKERKEELAKLELEISKVKRIQKLFHKKEYEALLKEREKKQDEVIGLQAKIDKFLRKIRNFIASHGILEEKDFTDDYPISKIILYVTELYNNFLVFLENAKSIKELNLNLNQVVQMLSASEIPLVLDDEDKEVIDNPIEFTSMEELVLVQKLNVFPMYNRILTPRERREKETFVLSNVGQVSYINGHNTIHFSVNGVKKEENGQYALIIPFSDMPISQLKASNPNDTYFEAGITIPSTAYLLCPEKAYNAVLKSNPSYTVIAYKGNDINAYIEAFISMTGRKVERISANGWVDRQDNRSFCTKNAFTNGTYQGSFEEMDKQNYEGISMLCSLINYFLENKIVVSNEMIINDIAKNIQLISLDKTNETLLSNAINNLNSFMQKYGLSLDENIIALIRKVYLKRTDLAIKELETSLTQELNISCENESLTYLLNLYLINCVLKKFIDNSLIQKPTVYQKSN